MAGSVVLVAYGAAHVAMLAPVAQALIAPGTPVVFLALTTAGAFLERLGMPYIGYRHLPDAQDKTVQVLGKRLLADLPSSDSVSEEESIAYMGLNYLDLVNRLGEAGAKQAYAKQGRQAFLPIALFKGWLILGRR